ncbi:uncharacterized protein LOC113205907 isoform X3 [Frankliniella occidentalis]|uniref:Uncharacterized protein LOC113205907 isoform X3 n=1 Tax=Frankliniella occidentalis TaxID=133901 RepID=A0A9C6WZA0_FRAOC|nr:uncharacterized protein LOC113205907 isoform X3 [Frankliniella occidentalis]XP_052125600.1 uncharacterized protein LOC113205907 isoform X3 [Frankliniella occidentalis]XP_052125601.1 uncharacterized protein LOC113205907 isoform X3 [Frankliniella occidentalis]
MDINNVLGLEVVPVIAIVPAGFGTGVSVLKAVTVEFSAGLWCATGLATLCTVLFLRCARTRDVSGAVLQALAPLLGQAPPPPGPPRPMLATWLLACVVLTAAYQGLLLGKLSSAVPRRDLDSLQDLEDSGLPLKVLTNVMYSHSLPLSNNLSTQAEFVAYPEIRTIIDTIATARNCALITMMDRHIGSHIQKFMIPPKKLHLFQLPYPGYSVIGKASRGSPLERPLSRALALVEASGLLSRWRSEEYARERRHHARRPVLQQGPRPLTLWQLGSAFVVLGVGQAAGLAAFALEVLCAWHARWSK